MRAEYESKIQDLQTQLDERHHELTALEVKLDANAKTNNCNIIGELEKSNFICSEDDVEVKKQMLENEEQEHLHYANDEEQSHITLTVGPVQDENSDEYSSNSENEESSIVNSDDSQHFLSSEFVEATLAAPNGDKEKLKKDVRFDLPEDEENKNSESVETIKKEEVEEDEKEHVLVDHIDSKTLKYHFQSTQNELKKRIEALDQQCKSNQLRMEELENLYDEEKNAHAEVKADNEVLKEELRIYKEDLEKSNKENRDLKNEVNVLLASKEIGAGDAISEKLVERESTKPLETSPNGKLVSYEELVSVEEELVLLKERFSQVNEDKVKLQHDIDGLREQYNCVRNQSHNMTFFYVAPLVLIVLYLLISKMFS